MKEDLAEWLDEAVRLDSQGSNATTRLLIRLCVEVAHARGLLGEAILIVEARAERYNREAAPTTVVAALLAAADDLRRLMGTP